MHVYLHMEKSFLYKKNVDIFQMGEHPLKRSTNFVEQNVFTI